MLGHGTTRVPGHDHGKVDDVSPQVATETSDMDE